MLRAEPKSMLVLSSASWLYLCTRTCWKQDLRKAMNHICRFHMMCELYHADFSHIVKWTDHHFFNSLGQLKYFLICFTCHYKISIIMLLQTFSKHENFWYIFANRRFHFNSLCPLFFPQNISTANRIMKLHWNQYLNHAVGHWIRHPQTQLKYSEGSHFKNQHT